MIVVLNGSYAVKYFRAGARTNTGAVINAGTFFPMQLEPKFQGYPLVEILNSISSFTDWLPYMRIDVHRYFNESYGLPDE